MQLYLDDDLWEALHALSKREKTTISDLVRQAVHDRYFGRREQRTAAMRHFVGIRKSRADEPDSTEQVRQLRRGSRLDRVIAP